MSSSQPDTDSITTLSAHLDHLASLNAEAKDLMPYKVDECSFAQGYVRQKVWSCRTCAAAYGRNEEGKGVGVCYACSVSCHAGAFAFSHFSTKTVLISDCWSEGRTRPGRTIRPPFIPLRLPHTPAKQMHPLPFSTYNHIHIHILIDITTPSNPYQPEKQIHTKLCRTVLSL